MFRRSHLLDGHAHAITLSHLEHVELSLVGGGRGGAGRGSGGGGRGGGMGALQWPFVCDSS